MKAQRCSFTGFRSIMVGVLGLSCAVLSSCNKFRQKIGSDVKIIGGTTQDGDQDPAVVAIYVEIMAREARFMCTGTLIAPNLVLTAAHCLNQPKLNRAHVFRVFSGADLRDPTKRPRAFTGGEAHFDPAFSYSNPKLGHDIGVLTLREPMDIKPIPYLRKPIGSDSVGKKVRAVGFGQSSGLLGTGSEVKRSTYVKINRFDDKFVEVGGFFHNVCNGDSGGPLLMEIDGVETIIGVNSFGTGSCHSSSTATRVDAFSSQIIDPVVQKALKP